MKYQKPKTLQKQSKVAILSPSWGGPFFFPQIYEKGLENLRKLDLIPIEFETARMDNDILYKNPEIRSRDLMKAFLDPSIDAIIASIGGDDSIRILPYLDLEIIQKNPKIFMGYSDSTTILTTLLQKGMITFHGPSIMSGFAQWSEFPQEVHNHFYRLLFEGKTSTWQENSWYSEGYPSWDREETLGKLNSPQQNHGWKWLHTPQLKVQGHLFGGCIEVSEMLKGTTFWNTSWEDKILFLETSEDKPSLDLITYWLRNYGIQGIFSKIKALLIGRPYGYSEEEKIKLEEVVKNVVFEEFKAQNITLIMNMDFGHTEPQWLMPLGGLVEIHCKNKTITLLEAVCSN